MIVARRVLILGILAVLAAMWPGLRVALLALAAYIAVMTLAWSALVRASARRGPPAEPLPRTYPRRRRDTAA